MEGAEELREGGTMSTTHGVPGPTRAGVGRQRGEAGRVVAVPLDAVGWCDRLSEWGGASGPSMGRGVRACYDRWGGCRSKGGSRPSSSRLCMTSAVAWSTGFFGSLLVDL